MKVGDKVELHLTGVVTDINEYGEMTIDTDDGHAWTVEMEDSGWVVVDDTNL